MSEQGDLLQLINEEEKKALEHDHKAKTLRNVYCEKYARFNVGDVVKFRKEFEGRIFKGKIRRRTFSTSPVGFTYTVLQLNQNGEVHAKGIVLSLKENEIID